MYIFFHLYIYIYIFIYIFIYLHESMRRLIFVFIHRSHSPVVAFDRERPFRHYVFELFFRC